MNICVVLCSFPSVESARQVGKLMVDRHLAACVNIIPQISSIYRWHGEVQEDDEVFALFKTSVDCTDKLKATIAEAHPYDLPAILILPVKSGSQDYFEWLLDVTKSQKPSKPAES